MILDKEIKITLDRAEIEEIIAEYLRDKYNLDFSAELFYEEDRDYGTEYYGCIAKAILKEV